MTIRLDAVLRNGRIWTQDARRPWARAIGVLNGRIVAVDDEIDGVSAAREHDLRGRLALPGFNDAHHHLSQRGYKLRQLDLRYRGAPTVDAVYDLLAARLAEKAGSQQWIIGVGYDENRLGAHPDKRVLDRLAPRTPVWLQQVSGHLGVINQAAADLIGLRDGAEPPSGGAFGRFEDDGTFNGVLYEQAQQLVFDLIKPVPREEWLRSIEYGDRLAVSEGITSATEPGVSGHGMSSNAVTDIGVFAEAAAAGSLRVRMTLMPELDSLHEVGPAGDGRDWWGVDLGIASGFGDDRVRIGAVKAFFDGSLVGQTAAVTEPYAGNRCNHGMYQGDPDELLSRLELAHRHGWQLGVHAIGDAAIDRILDLVARLQSEDGASGGRRHRIEHAGIVRDDQIRRFKDLGVVPVGQPRFLSELGDGMISALGDRVHLAYRARSFLDAGVPIVGSSDAPVVEGAPILGIHDAVNRRTAEGRLIGPDERVTVAQAVAAFTVGSAYAAHEERLKGRVVRGHLADLVVLSEDVFRTAPENIQHAEVVETFIGGERVYGEEI